MASLSDTLRRRLEKTMVEAREVAEAGARAALQRLAVDRSEPFAEMTPEERDLRIKLRAHARQLGDPRKPNGEQEIGRLVVECAYAHWHRMLFARFLAENHLLIHPELRVPVTLAECAELAAKAGEKDGWGLAGRFAARMLPAIFRPDDPVLAVRLAPEHQQRLEGLLAGLPAEVFTADDSLGWVYQFWQAKRKEEINEAVKGGRKIGADELPVVTQLFTEPYMVKFLLHNTLGAWWAGKVLAQHPEFAKTAGSEEELRRACALPGYDWSYLRFVREDEAGPWRPAAGTFQGWPKRAAEITVLDPCCGSGHFLVEAFRILVPMRIVEEGLSVREACDAVLHENLFGLEIDERCTQIAAFNLAFTAWTYPGAGGYRPLLDPHIACSGLAVGASKDDWTKLGLNHHNLRIAMGLLYDEFQHAPLLGSLLDPSKSMAAKLVDWHKLQPLLQQALAQEDVKRDAVATEAGIAAQGLAKAAASLIGKYTLVATNVPYLGRGKQDDILRAYLEKHFQEGKADLATAFLLRCLDFCAQHRTVALVLPQNWLFLKTYKKLRELLLKQWTWNLVAQLGEHAFKSSAAAGAFVALFVLSAAKPSATETMVGIDVSAPRGQRPIYATEKAAILCGKMPAKLAVLPQAQQLNNPDSVVTFVLGGTTIRLERYATCYQGASTLDIQRFRLNFWEITSFAKWNFHMSTPTGEHFFSGMNYVSYSRKDGEVMHELALHTKQGTGAAFAWLCGKKAWGKKGVACSWMNDLPAALYYGPVYDNMAAVIIPSDENLLPAIWTYCSSHDFLIEVRKINQKVQVANATLVKVPFDLTYWQKVAAEKYPNGLPKPFSNDPTQWIFHGHPCGSVMWDEEKKWTVHGPLRTDDTVLQVAVARLLGYRWPAELDREMELAEEQREWVRRCEELLDLADEDGIVCIPPVRGEQPAADRLQRVLACAYGTAWSPAILSKLLERVGFAGKALEDWLRYGFFEQHCRLFHQRPFIWHIWDGRRDGFAALVNYHKLDRKRLERLTYAVLGDWIEQQLRSAKAGERGAENRLVAALELQEKLKQILDGEPPHDIFVRWKPLHEQPIGWEPDLNDGVRVNIRPFVEAGVLRKTPNIKWTKDRGREPESLRSEEDFPWFWQDGHFTGERVNDVNLTNAKKRAARERLAGARKGATE